MGSAPKAHPPLAENPTLSAKMRSVPECKKRRTVDGFSAKYSYNGELISATLIPARRLLPGSLHRQDSLLTMEVTKPVIAFTYRFFCLAGAVRRPLKK
jgi:hypothetical protein